MKKQDTKVTTEPTKSRLAFILAIQLVELDRHSVTQLFYSSHSLLLTAVEGGTVISGNTGEITYIP